MVTRDLQKPALEMCVGNELYFFISDQIRIVTPVLSDISIWTDAKELCTHLPADWLNVSLEWLIIRFIITADCVFAKLIIIFSVALRAEAN